jgi:hypothetical protein
MAKQNSLIPFTGTLGNLIGYQRNGEFFLRSKPETPLNIKEHWRFRF